MGLLQPIKTNLVAVIAIIAVSLGAFLLCSSARAAEIAVNDDYGGTLTSTIVTTLPISGSYTILASSYSGQGGMYDVAVEPEKGPEQPPCLPQDEDCKS